MLADRIRTRQTASLTPILRVLAVAVALAAGVSPAAALDFYVDLAIGNDANSAVQAQSPATPWKTIGKALSVVGTGNTIRVRPGTYAEAPASRVAGVKLVADGPARSVVVAPPSGSAGLRITHTDVTVEGFVFRGGVHGIRAEGADGLVVRACTAVAQSANGFTVVATDGVTIESSVAVSSGSRGILLDATSNAYVRNVLVHDAGEWGIGIENVPASGALPPVSTGNVIAFATIAFNGGGTGGGIRVRNAIAEIRDSVLADNEPYGIRLDTIGSSLHHDLVSGSTITVSPLDYAVGAGAITGDPLFVLPAGPDGIRGGDGFADDDFSLAQIAAGQGAQSPAVDAGSGDVATRDIGGSTRSDGLADAGTADLGFHAGAPASTGRPPVQASGAVYFVDAATGDDARTKLDAQSQATPWRTIGRALQSLGGARPKDTVLVAPGTYAEAVRTSRRGVRMQALGDAVVVPPSGAIGVDVAHARTFVEGFTVQGGLHGIRATAAKGVVLRRNTVRSQSGNGILVLETKRALVDGNRIEDTGAQGIVLKRCERSYVRNNVVAGAADWGIHLDNGDPPLPRRTDNNVVAFNTVYGNGRTQPSGGVRFQAASGEIRDNVVAGNRGSAVKTDTTGTLVHHNALSGSSILIDTAGGALPSTWANVYGAPGFVNAAAGDFHLRQEAAGDASTSACVDAGSAPIGSADISGSTRADGAADEGPADLGYHEAADDVPRRAPPIGPAPTPTPTPAPTVTPAPTPTPAPGAGPLHYVDCASGDDARSRDQAQNPATPWRTVGRAAAAAVFGDVIVVKPGTCREAVEVDQSGLTFRSETPRAAVVVPPDGQNAFDVQASDVTLQDFVIRAGFQGVLVANSRAGQLVERVVLRGLVVRPRASGRLTANGLQIRDARAVTVENCVVTGAVQQGILLKRVQHAYVRNNLVYAVPNDWGISFDNASGTPPSTGNVAAFNTVTGCGHGLRFLNTAGEIRDNVLAFNGGIGLRFDQPGAGSLVHHNDAFGNTTNYDMPSGFDLRGTNLSVDPGFVDPASGIFALRDTAAGEPSTSPLIDAGSGSVEEVDVSGSTRSDGVEDDGIADIGYHADAAASLSPPGGPGANPGAAVVTLYVDCARGDDTRSRAQADSPATPLRTIAKALSYAVTGDVVVVQAGTCSASVTIDVPGVTLRTASPLATVLSPPTGTAGIAVRAGGVLIDGFVVRSDKEGVVVAARKSGDVLGRVRLRGLRIEPPPGGSIATNGIRAQDVDRMRIESCTVDGATQQGIVVKRASRSWIRNNRVTSSGEWGIHVDNGDPPAPATTGGQVVAFNTVVGSGRVASTGGIRFQNATGEIRDNVLADNAGSGIRTDQSTTVVHHNLVARSAIAFDRVSGSAAPLWANLTADPLFGDAGGGDWTLQQTAAGQGATSPAVDTGSGPVAALEISGSTRRDGVADGGVADMGFHAGAAPLGSPPAIATPPGAAGNRTLYVSAATGDDARSEIDVQNAATPWRTIGRSLASNGAATGDTVIVAAGTYAESVQTSRSGVTLRANGAVTIVPPPGGTGIAVQHALTRVEGFTVQGGLHGIRAEGAAVSTIRGCTLRGQSGNGIFVVQSDFATIDDNRVADAAGQGIVVKRAGFAYVRNNLVTRTGDWGIQIDNGDTPLPPVTGGHVLAFNTVYGCGRSAGGSGGIRLQNATGEVRDNLAAANVGSAIKTDTAPTVVHHNAVSGSVTRFDTKSGAEPYLWANVVTDPQLGDPASDDFTLKQAVAGQAVTSPAVDAGSGSVAERDIAGSTRSDAVADTGVADIGWHAAAGSGGPRPSPVPKPSVTPIPKAGSGLTFHVDPAGDDARNALDAQSAASPWKTVARAIQAADPGDVIVLAPGTYAEAVQVTRDALTLRGSGTLGDVVLSPPSDAPGIFVNGRSGVVLEDLVVRGGAQGVVGNGAAGIVLRRLAIVSPATNGVQLTSATGAVIDGCIITGAGTQGLLLRQTGGAYVRNNLVYANTEWAITFDNGGDSLPAPVTGNVVAFNTVHANGKGIRLLNASGEIRDNQITEQADIGLYLAGPNLLVHHNNFSANVRDRDQESAYQATIRIWATLGTNPRYVRPAGVDGVLGGTGWRDDDFRLKQITGQTPVSTMVDAGSGLASALDISGSTRSDGVADAGVADVGFHYEASPATAPPAFATPPNGTQATYYVSASDGSNSNSRASARSRGTPWKTIAYAMSQISSGDTVVVLPGDYGESVQVQKVNVTLIAETPGTVTILPPSAASANGIAVERSGVTVDGFVIRGATNNGISVLAGSNAVRIRSCAVVGAAAEGIRAASSDDVLVQDSVVTGAIGSGILLRQVTNGTVRNNLVYDNAEWGISIDNSTGSSVATGQLVERNTAAFNGTGDLRLANARGVVRDNLLTNTSGIGLRIDTAGSTLLNNGFDETLRDVDPDRYVADSCTGCSGNLRRAVRFRLPAGLDGVRGGAGWADDDFRLAQTAAGDAAQSEAVDAGSALVSVLGATGTTAADGRDDTGAVDLGFHYASSSRAIAPLVAAPAAASVAAPHALADNGVARAVSFDAGGATPAATPAPAETPRASRTPTPRSTPIAPPRTPAPREVRSGTTWFVDAANGDDARAAVEAVSADTPWRTIARALAAAAPGDTIVLAEGRYRENVTLAIAGLTLRGADGVRIVARDARRPALRVRDAGSVTIERVEVVGGVVAKGGVRGLRLAHVAVAGAPRDAIALAGPGPITIEDAVVRGAARDGVRVRAGRVEMRDVVLADNARAGLRVVRGTTVLRDVVVEGNAVGVAVDGGAALIEDTAFRDNASDVTPPDAPLGAGTTLGP